MQATTARFILLLLCALFALVSTLNAQWTQHIRGTVVDGVLQKPLAGATITLKAPPAKTTTVDATSALNRTTTTDSNGNFSFRNVPVGKHTITITHIGYKENLLDNIEVAAGKETVLTLPLETASSTEKAVVVTSNSRRNRPLNEMSVVSARAFSVEETRKYAAALNDPLRMATSFAGVMAPFDGSNDIVIRGNSPTGLLWRMEGVEIPNPNHFSSAASSGGGISILSAQLLANSDFLTGAFPAEYGNALSGVFDLHLRKGNDEKREYTLQAGVLGLDATAEGPLSAAHKGSFLVNYRYSTLALLSKIGIGIPDGSINFQDLSYNISLPTSRAGQFTFFGFGGLSTQTTDPKKDSAKWKEQDDRYRFKYDNPTGITGITHNIFLGNRTSLRSVLALSYTGIGIKGQYLENDYSFTPNYNSEDKTRKWTLSSTLDHRFNNGSLLRTGAILNLVHYNFYQQAAKSPIAPLEEQINTGGQTQTIQAFAQYQVKPLDHFTVNAGLHYLELLYNHSRALEPRASLKWEIDRKSSLSFGYGLHSQIQQLGIYFAQDTNAGGVFYHPNTNLGLTHAHHYVLSYSYRLSPDLNLKTELYYQALFNVPVNANDTNTFSTLNIESGDYVSDPLTNKGKGRNYGIELTLEKYLSHNFYYLLNTSLYQSKYTALDGIERNTRFNGNYLINGVAGKDFVWTTQKGKAKTFGVNLKLIYGGGYRTTPIDGEQSRLEQKTVYYQKEAYTQQNAAYFRTDLRFSLKRDYHHLTTTLSLDLQNLTGNKNVYSQSYDIVKGKVITDYQVGLIPVLNYKVEF